MNAGYELCSASYCFYFFLVLTPGYESKGETKQHTLFHLGDKIDGSEYFFNISSTIFSPSYFIWIFEKLHLFAIMALPSKVPVFDVLWPLPPC